MLKRILPILEQFFKLHLCSTDMCLILLVVRQRTGTGLAGVFSAVGGVSVISLLALLAVFAPGVVSAVLLLSHGTLGGVEVAEVVNNNMGAEDDLRQRLQGDALPSQWVAGGGVVVAVALLTDWAPHVPPGGQGELERGINCF